MERKKRRGRGGPITGELKCDYSSSICGWDGRAIRVLRVEVQGTGWQAEKYSRVSDGERRGREQ